mmetsp:Transcript_7824/g.22442  ORF Transcript_7824/g.22442 Transcript_7824/m.22442 type:complete len:242 (+) Transcript_7824:1666-2391(+)
MVGVQQAFDRPGGPPQLVPSLPAVAGIAVFPVQGVDGLSRGRVPVDLNVDVGDGGLVPAAVRCVHGLDEVAHCRPPMDPHLVLLGLLVVLLACSRPPVQLHVPEAVLRVRCDGPPHGLVVGRRHLNTGSGPGGCPGHTPGVHAELCAGVVGARLACEVHFQRHGTLDPHLLAPSRLRQVVRVLGLDHLDVRQAHLRLLGLQHALQRGLPDILRGGSRPQLLPLGGEVAVALLAVDEAAAVV